MKGPLDRLADRVLSMLGLDFELDLSEQPFSRISDSITLGRRPKAADLDALRSAQITHVISCLPEAQRPKVVFLESEFRCLFLPVHDGIHEDIASGFPDVFRFVESAREGDPEARVLVHCEVGVSRSATLVTALMMKRERLRFFDAFSAVRERRAQVLPNIGFASQLQRLERELFPEPEPGELSSLARYLCERCNAPVDPKVMQSALEQHDHDARRALEAVFGGEIPRVVQGVRA
ncbi:MAG: dual specificity protein phosphatase family protein [Deltaproteobacteria bacterium]|nr:dual specificity protein phosphatase family protein [Deltaproteobacteria bacterium]